MPVELRWDGKYTADGRKVAPLKVALPFQTVETVNESVQERQRGLEALFGGASQAEWRNRLIWGDKKYVLPSLLPQFAGKVNLIYIDPPFATGDDFSIQVSVEGEQFTKEPSVIEQKAYRDTWGRGLDGYLQWFYETVVLLRELLAENGSIYVHLDWHIGHYAKAVMDEIFGLDNFLGEIVWKRTSSHNDPNKPGNIHDTIFYYSKSTTRVWNQQYQSHDKDYLEKVYVYEDENGRYRLGDLTAPGISKGVTGKEWRSINPTSFGRHWRTSPKELEVLLQQGKIKLKKDGVPSINGWKQYLSETKGMSIQSIWSDMPNVTGISSEKLKYPTQKPETLLERIIKASSNEGDLILDCFCGSGTTAAVAEKLHRRWITCDLGRFAIHTARKRLLSIPNVKPFIVQNLGKYERQAWQRDEFGSDEAKQVAAYTKFILELYRAQPLNGFAWLHGLRNGRAVHVGAVDAPVTVGDVKNILIEWRKNLGKTGATNAGIDILGWEFALDMNETAKQQAAEAGVDLKFCIIPREVLEKKAVEQGDIQFFELAALFVEPKVKKRELKLELTNFVAPLEYVPQEIREKITKWESWIDYWAIDFDFRSDTFHNQWQSYRTRKDRKLDLTATHTYPEAGEYTVQVKVIDILGNDTTRTLRVSIK